MTEKRMKPPRLGNTLPLGWPEGGLRQPHALALASRECGSQSHLSPSPHSPGSATEPPSSSAGRRARPPSPASVRRMCGCARTQDGRPLPVSQTGSEAIGLLVKMAAVYLGPPLTLPSLNMAVAPLLLPRAEKPVCPQSIWRLPVSGGCGEGTEWRRVGGNGEAS